MIYFSYPKAGYLKYSQEIDKSIQTVLNSDRYIKGENVAKFEKIFSNYIGTKYSVGVGNATDAIYFSLNPNNFHMSTFSKHFHSEGFVPQNTS